MKTLFTLLALFPLAASAAVSLISDFDDTIKITHVSNPAAATFRGIFRARTFTGMSDFLEGADYFREVHILTASPGIIKPAVYRTLRRNGITYNSVIFKNPLRFEDKIHFKVRKIEEILAASPDDFILMGDDVDKDPEVFEEVKRLHPDRIISSYIHVVRNRAMPQGSVRYWTAADLALREMLAGRMSEERAEAVLTSLVEENKLTYVIPRFADCPKSDVFTWQLDTSLSSKASQVIQRLGFHCAALVKQERVAIGQK